MAPAAEKAPFDRRPLLIAVAGPNGAGKTTFCRYHLADLRLRYVNADLIARELGLDPYEAATLTTAVRESLVRERESFVFETVFSDPAGTSSPSSSTPSRRDTQSCSASSAWRTPPS